MQDQEMFEQAYRHLMTQGGRSCVRHPRGLLIPAYYGDHGRQCPVGLLIPPEQYDPSFEAMSLEQLIPRCSALQELNHSLLFALQTCHDTLTPPRWKKRLQILADAYKLVVTPELEALRLNEGPQEYYPC